MIDLPIDIASRGPSDCDITGFDRESVGSIRRVVTGVGSGLGTTRSPEPTPSARIPPEPPRRESDVDAPWCDPSNGLDPPR